MTFPLEISTQLLIDGAWVDVSGDVLQRDPLTITRGRSNEDSQGDPSRCALTLKNATGTYSPRNPAGTYYGFLGRNTPLRVLTPGGADTYLSVPGGVESYVSTPDVAALGITGDIDVRIDITRDNWTPAGAGTSSIPLAEKFDYDGQCSWSFYITNAGTLGFWWSSGGTFVGGLSAPSTVAVPATSTRLALRATLDVNDGAGGLDLRFYTAPTIDGSWTQLGATVHAALTTSIFDSTAEIRIGGDTFRGVSAPGDGFQGRIHAFELYSGIAGSLVADADFRELDTVVPTFVDSEGLTWTFNGGAVVVDPNARFHGEVAKFPPTWDTSGNDVASPIEAAGVMRRLGQGQAALKSVMYRGLTTVAESVVAYWPCEDTAGATELASGLPGHPAIVLLGTVDAASFSDFKASLPIPTGSSVRWIGDVPAYTQTTEASVRFLMAVPSGGVSGTATVCKFYTSVSPSAPPTPSDSILRWLLDVETDGDLKLRIFDSTTEIYTGSSIAFGVNGKLLRVAIDITHDGTDIDWTVSTLEVGQTSGSTTSGTLSTRTFGRVLRVEINPSATLDDTAVGHVSVQSSITSIFDLADELNAYSGELAAARIARLCLQEGVPVTIIGDAAATSAVGAQRPATLVDLIREAAAADMGILHEPRGFLGLAYRTRESMYAQEPAPSLDYSDAALSRIAPTEDDQGTRNDVTVSRTDGGSARTELATGPLSVNAPPDGVGRYAEQVTVNLGNTGDLPDHASWRVHVGTVDEARYPVLGVNLARPLFDDEVGNLVPPNTSSMETSIAAWSSGGTVPPTVTQSNTRAWVGTWSMRIAWGTGGVLPLATTVDPIEGFVVGRTYTVSGYGYVPTGDPGLFMAVEGIGLGSAMTTKNAWTRFTVTFVATQHRHRIQVWPDASPTAGDFAWVDGVQVWEGSAAVTYTSTLLEDTADAQVQALDVGDKVAVSNLPAWVSPDGTVQLAQGFTETLSRFEWLVDVNCAPASPYDVAVYDAEDGAGEARYSSDGSTLAEDLTTVETGVDVATATGPLWSSADAPFDIVVGGERMTVTTVTGTTSPQTFTVTRSVNGVVKTHATGAAVRLFKQGIYAL